MGQVNEGGFGGFQLFMGEGEDPRNEFSNADEVDLNLRLSLTGTSNEKPTFRSSSPLPGKLAVSGFDVQGNPRLLPLLPPAAPPPQRSFVSMLQSYSLPPPAERGQRRFAELPPLRRVEPKMGMLQGPMVHLVAPPPELPTWPAATAARNVALSRALQNISTHGDASRIPSIEGQGSSAVTTAFFSQSFPEWGHPEYYVMPVAAANGRFIKPPEIEQGNPFKKAKISGYNMQESGLEVMKQMPSVTTIGQGPNGRRIEGFLYRYLKGQISIVCVCHGQFFSPEEFVKHAGGDDVPNPMRHISVSPTYNSNSL
ncbi:ninja-family protein Os03g0419100-like [Malania oleifera]|uniref:ninja-family protein Os03g0419100-like n=1 Tax=Malania oleifera TaxID=397392 RepID=UPI0025ADA76B|nr:ninja-family protein Os03g0419100-like [Malania oleifera]XP_057952316.1 ninja-family protein Os03g0419100-like [Malania oleifera]XP_057952317.1 ninja-family protein Os03g0419100-like [Malania oleifera]